MEKGQNRIEELNRVGTNVEREVATLGHAWVFDKKNPHVSAHAGMIRSDLA